MDFVEYYMCARMKWDAVDEGDIKWDTMKVIHCKIISKICYRNCGQWRLVGVYLFITFGHHLIPSKWLVVYELANRVRTWNITV